MVVPVYSPISEKNISEASTQLNQNLSKQGLLIKRLFDLTAGLAIFLLCLPLLLVFTILIKLDSTGPALFIQKRIGKSGTIFYCFKFRTMVNNAEEKLQSALKKDLALEKEWEANFKLKNDPRITRVGKFLRKTSLDELPQLLNVVRGEMSLVGPRPRPLYELEGRENDPVFHIGLSVRPGMTGLWQVSGRNELDFKQRIMLDAVYVNNWSLGSDISLLCKTVGVILRQKGAF